MERPKTPSNEIQDLYQGSPVVGTPGKAARSKANTTCEEKEVVIVKFTDINMTTSKKVSGRIGVKGQVEKTASLGFMKEGPAKNVAFFAVNISDDEFPMHKIRVSAFGENSKWISSFSGGSRIVIENPLILPVQSRFMVNGVNIRYELRLHSDSKVVVELDNSYVHHWVTINDLLNKNIENGKTVSIAGVARDISELITYQIANPEFNSSKFAPTSDRELSIQSLDGKSSIMLSLHGATAKAVSVTEEGIEMYFGPLKVVWHDADGTVFLESIPYESKRCNVDGKPYLAPKTTDAANGEVAPALSDTKVSSNTKNEIDSVAQATCQPDTSLETAAVSPPADLTHGSSKNCLVVDLTEGTDKAGTAIEAPFVSSPADLSSSKKHEIANLAEAPTTTKLPECAENVELDAVKIKKEKIEPEDKKRSGRKSKKDN